jgi:hypothetical protein
MTARIESGGANAADAMAAAANRRAAKIGVDYCA